jgi:hypothetical protein
MKLLRELLINDIGKMSMKQHFYYWIFPAIILGVFMVFYFSEIPALVKFVSPPENREWGILENLQLGIILGILILAIYAFFKKDNLVQKFGFVIVAIFALFVFLEEMDYGAHFAQLVGGEKELYLKKYIPAKNIHNQGNNAINFKRGVKILMALIFLIAPFFKSRIKNPYIKYLIPQPRILIVGILAIVVDRVPKLIVEYGLRKDGGLGINIAEFSEVMVYYTFLIYMIQLIFVNYLELGQKLE